MTPESFNIIMDSAFKFMPSKMNSRRARAMLLAIALQESQFQNRNQIGGPANGYFQFELIGVRGTILHYRTGVQVQRVCEHFGYGTAQQIHLAIEDNDLLATVLARYNLYNYPGALPGKEDVEEAWRQYLSRWRPGKPHRQRWTGYYNRAWKIVSC